MTKSIKLRCREAYTRDVGRGFIRIDYDVMNKLKISTGDIVEIEGKKKTVAKVLPLYPADEEKSMARTDSIVRENMELIIDEEIIITKTTAHAAILIIVRPIEASGNKWVYSNIPPIDEKYLTDCFEGSPMSSDDRVIVPYFGGRLNFQIVRTDPKGAVVVTRSTKFLIEESKKDKKVTCPTCGSLV